MKTFNISSEEEAVALGMAVAFRTATFAKWLTVDQSQAIMEFAEDMTDEILSKPDTEFHFASLQKKLEDKLQNPSE